MTDPITRTRITQAERQHLLYKPWTDANCQLYLPFSDLSFWDNPFYSKDQNHIGIGLTAASLGPRGYLFDGLLNVINCGNDATAIDMTAMTLIAWIYPTGLGGASAGRIFDKQGASGQGSMLQVLATARFAFAADFDGAADLYRATANNSLVLSTWQMVATTWDGSATATNVHHYVNGVEDSYSGTSPTDGIGNRTSDAANNLLIGNNNGAIRGFAGTIDTVIVYNRALTALEISNLYQGSKWYYGL